MAKVLRTYKRESASTPGKFYEQKVQQAKTGEHRGKLYIVCDCMAGSNAVRGQKPCRHIADVFTDELFGVSLVQGHLQAA